MLIGSLLTSNAEAQKHPVLVRPGVVMSGIIAIAIAAIVIDF